ncbi:MAG: hypothetical protein HC840_13830 [Leptolyngbyaceae cyanobacterium RM2_2_4]|nr:hypothetical protein [Leptolyngbyaceae cyanobacterium SM1_4_3]NJN90107.1 hypothetical protein [Leptolyngbyaceae cyanobacterium SL_5_14]NJO50327.1 hypothetical protein [Leptolyngbyaceae cyanobacterium RM2_2_4]
MTLKKTIGKLINQAVTLKVCLPQFKPVSDRTKDCRLNNLWDGQDAHPTKGTVYLIFNPKGSRRQFKELTRNDKELRVNRNGDRRLYVLFA